MSGLRVSRRRGVAEELIGLEAEERKLAARMQRDQIRRNVLQDRIRRLRIGGLTGADHARYVALRYREERL